jgi:hypothetical protein
MSMPLTTGAGLDMPYSATPVRRAVSDIPWQLEKIDKSTVRNGGAWEEVLAKMHRARALEVHRYMPNSPASFHIPQLFRIELFKEL